jgi:hypothetical protein
LHRSTNYFAILRIDDQYTFTYCNNYHYNHRYDNPYAWDYHSDSYDYIYNPCCLCNRDANAYCCNEHTYSFWDQYSHNHTDANKHTNTLII